MGKSKSKTASRSKCCNAKVKVVGNVTMYHVCTKCHQPCDTFYVERKTWEINPKTRVVPNKKHRDDQRELNELRRMTDV
jgi:hypothetical protein